MTTVFSLCAWAGGPRFVAGSSYFNSSTMGQPITWPLGQITYYTDQGDLSPILPNTAANALVASSFSQWTSVSIAALTATAAGQLAEDVNGSNIQVNASGTALVLLAAVLGWWQQAWLRERVYALANAHPLTVAQELALKAQDAFQECTDCPAMVVVPAGSFMMGSPSAESGRKPDEDPQHAVTFAQPFAVSKFEVTFADWDACVAHGDCDPHVSDGGFGRGAQPLINVTWADARQYIAWLSAATGKPYRLLSEAEYEYAARAGSQTAYPWGSQIGTGNANCIGCGGQWNGKQPAPVGSFPANRFGLYDMNGNVWQWVQDCVHDSYQGAPQDGSAWTRGNTCNSRVARGGTFNVLPAAVRSGNRLLITSSSLYFNLGLRVGRTLSR